MPVWQCELAQLREESQTQSMSILEIGAFEGASTTWLLDNLLSHPQSTLTTVDTFRGGMEHNDPAFSSNGAGYKLGTLEQRFSSNVSFCDHHKKLRVLKTTSDEALLHLRLSSSSFDLIYIDASHIAIDVLHDAVLSWRLLALGGTIIFDDYGWKGYLEDCLNPRIAIKAFVKCVDWECESWVIEGIAPQMWVKKVGRRFEGTANPDPGLLYKEGDEGF